MLSRQVFGSTRSNRLQSYTATISSTVSGSVCVTVSGSFIGANRSTFSFTVTWSDCTTIAFAFSGAKRDADVL